MIINERILIVDPSPHYCEILSEEILKPCGYQTFSACDGQTGLKIAVEQHLDLILLATELTNPTMMDILRHLNHQGMTIPTIIMLPPHNRKKMPLEALRLGVKDYLVKPFEPAELLSRLDQTLSNVRLLKERYHLKNLLSQAQTKFAQSRRELNTLLSIGRSATNIADYHKFWLRIVEAAVYLTQAEEGSLLLLNEKSHKLNLVASCGVDERLTQSFQLNLYNSLAGRAIVDGQPVVAIGSEAAQADLPYPVEALLYVPLVIKQQTRGLLRVSNRHRKQHFDNQAIRLLSALADYAAILWEHKQVVNQANQKQETLWTILNGLDKAIALTSGSAHQIAFMNPTFQALFDLEAVPFYGQPLAKLVSHAGLLKLLTTAHHRDHQGEIAFKDGRTFKVWLTPLAPTEQLILLEDITHLKRLAQLKEEFVNNLFSQLYLPLNSLKQCCQLISRPEAAKQPHLIDCLHKSLHEMSTVMDELHYLTLLETELAIETQTVNLDQLLLELVSQFQEQAYKKQQQLVYHSPGQAVYVAGNEFKLSLAIQHLVANALRHTPPQGRISIVGELQPKHISLKIADTGPGLSLTDQLFVFDKFVRISRKNQPADESLMGLALCKSVIEQHQGHIWVQSHPQQGTIFTFTLPLAVASPAPQPAHSDRSSV